MSGEVITASGSGARPSIQCAVCEGSQLTTFYRQKEVPVHSALLLADRESAVNYPTGDIELAFCDQCAAISNVAFEPNRLEYDAAYDGSQAFSPTFGEFHRQLAADLIARCGVRDQTILEVGCGRGEFLELLCSLGNNRGVGFDPSSAARCEGVGREDAVRLVNGYFPADSEDISADLACCKMTLEHIARPVPLVRAMERSLSPSGSRTMFLQVPEAGRIFDQGAFWDIYYEHCNYFCAASLAVLTERCGFATTSDWTGYDDQYLMLLARAGTAPSGDSRAAEVAALRRSVTTFSKRCAAAVSEWRGRLQDLHRRGRSAVLWGAGSKAVAYLCATQLDSEISCLVDINPRKHGTFAPKTGHPIVAPAQLASIRPDVVVLMNPVYRHEIARDLERLNVTAEVWTL